MSQLALRTLAAQFAICLGYAHYRMLGATLVGLTFVLPSLLVVLVLGWAYVRFGRLSWMQAVFCGVSSAVVGIVVMSAKKLTEKSVGKDSLLRAIYQSLAAVTIATESEAARLFIAASVFVWFRRALPRLASRGGIHALAVPDWLKAPACSQRRTLRC